MKITNKNTVLITGGSAGIGFEIAKLFVAQGVHVIITGRDKIRLQKAKDQLTNVTAIPFDVSKPEDIRTLAERIKKEFPSLNVLINNAGKAFAYHLSAQDAQAYDKAEEEMLTNYFSIVRLNEALLPLLKQQPEAAIINVSSVVAFVPSAAIPTYSASKAALHSYTQSLRISLSQTNVKVFELMPPLVNTELSKDIGGENGIAPSQVADELLASMQKDEYEVHVGFTAQLYKQHLASPDEALAGMNASFSVH